MLLTGVWALGGVLGLVMLPFVWIGRLVSVLVFNWVYDRVSLLSHFMIFLRERILRGLVDSLMSSLCIGGKLD